MIVQLSPTGAREAPPVAAGPVAVSIALSGAVTGQALQRLCTECGERFPVERLHLCRDCLREAA